MKPASNPVVNDHQVLLEFDPVTEIVSLHYERERPRSLKTVQQFPLITIVRSGLVWDEATARFVLTSSKKPSRAVTMADFQSEATVSSKTKPTLPSHIFWADL